MLARATTETMEILIVIIIILPPQPFPSLLLPNLTMTAILWATWMSESSTCTWNVRCPLESHCNVRALWKVQVLSHLFTAVAFSLVYSSCFLVCLQQLLSRLFTAVAFSLVYSTCLQQVHEAGNPYGISAPLQEPCFLWLPSLLCPLHHPVNHFWLVCKCYI